MKRRIVKIFDLSQTLLVIVLSVFCGFTAFATIVTSELGGGTGDWEDGTTWDTGAQPGCGDTIYIAAGDEVEINGQVNYEACSEPMFLEVYGTLTFTGGNSRLFLPAGSGVSIKSGGLLSAPGGGGGNSRQLDIGGATVWQKSMGSRSGPESFGSPLPVSLVQFSAIWNEGVVDFYWSTASEVNNEYFVIERSKDGFEWDEVVRVEGAGNSTEIIEYYDFDSDPISGKSYYRLTQVDFDGKSTTFNVVPVQSLSDGEIAFDIFPNPTTMDNINLSFEGFEGKDILVVLRDIQGKEYYSKIQIIESQNQIVAFSPDVLLPKGVYLITASSQDELYSQKVIIQ